MIVVPYLNRLRAYVESADYAGYDPFDALNSPLVRFLTGKRRWARMGAMQFLRRCPVNLRPILGIRKGHNPKAIGLFIWGYAKLHAVERVARYLERIAYLLDLLEQLKSSGYSGNCWGYNFDWQNKVMYVPKGTPTIVNSAFIGHALIDTHLLCGLDRALEAAVSIKDFIMRDLNRHREGDRFCFSYTPFDSNFVHNANLLGASLLIRLHRICGDKELEDAGLASLAYSLKHQRDDGAWNYAETEVQRWVDSFHTGFSLQALQYFISEGYGSHCQSQYESGLKYYTDHFFMPDGTPKFYDNKLFPIDIHSPCQAIVVLSNPLAGCAGLAIVVLKWMLRHMYSRNGYFYFRKGRLLTNKIPYMRWSQAWAFHALASYSLNMDRQPQSASLHPREPCEFGSI
jgi:hypothetical protein